MTTLASNIQSQDYRYAVTLPQGTWRWTTRVDVSQAAPVFQIRDIYSPFGLLRDSIAIPGDVITAMGNSVNDLKAAFAPAIVFSPSALSFTVDEGRGFVNPLDLTISNGGVYGSLLSTALTTSAAYVKVAPASVSSLAFNASGQTEVSVDSTFLLATSSPYAASVTIQDTSATNNPQTLPITIIVRPKATISLSPTALGFTDSSDPDAPIPPQTFQIQNTGLSGSVLQYLVQKLTGLSPWLTSITPASGTLTSSATQNITVTVAPTPDMLSGTFTETLRVSGYSSNSYQDVVVTLTLL